MKISYDPDVDVIRIRLSDEPIDESDEQTSGIITDLNASGEVIGFEILSASKRVANPRSVEWELAKPATTLV